MPACALCTQDRELHRSHIVPRFVFDYLKKTSATGYFRYSNQPNRRAQDGRKIPLLCFDCEQRLSSLEKWFSEAVFRPYSADRTAVIHYDSRLLRFAVSLSWRVLLYYDIHNHLSHISALHVNRVEAALETWRRVLLDELPHPGKFEQHLLPMDELQSATVPDLPANINRYLLRAVDMDVVTGEQTALVYIKLPRIAVVGFIEMPGPRNRWQGTRIAAGSGTLKPRQFVVPQAFGEYMVGQARKAAAALASMSEQQKEVVNRAALQNLDRAAESESIRAMKRDVDMFGLAAFHPSQEHGSGQ